MYTVENIIVYPIKSLGGITVESAKATEKGFENDRRWMLVDREGKFQTQRESAELSLFKTKFTKDGIVVNYKNAEVIVPFTLHNNTVRDVNVFSHTLQTQEVDSSINTWFSDRLNKDVQLVKMTEISKRTKAFVKPPFSSKVSLADGYPYLILGTESIAHLNNKLEQKLSHDRFRTNLYVTTDTPHCEDDWKKIKIGSAEFKNIKPCARCTVTTINQQTGNKGVEPLKTLSQYRKVGNKINFGSNMILQKTGQVNVGDEVIVL